MNAISKWTIALTLLAGAAYAQVPSTNDKSDGFENTGMGTGALIHVAPNGTYYYGYGNTAAGYNALYTNTTGSYNTAFGLNALSSDTSGCCNDAFGIDALRDNTTGENNSAFGTGALSFNSTGTENTATGQQALGSNTTGSYNTATGISALYQNETTNWNTADGWGALQHNDGSDNTATGGEALYNNSTGSWNTATGYRALYSNYTGHNNTAMGISALLHNRAGSNNIALGYHAGDTLTTGSNNIEIGNVGTASDNNMIKIGTEGTQAETFIAGIYNTSVTGSAVMVNSSGQLGVVVSSERFKTAIAPMGTNTAKLQQLRPVTFKLKTDADGTLQYGLIAEEVAKVYPELVVRDSQGRIDGVRYDELAPMLLNEVQKQQMKLADVDDLKQHIVTQDQRAAAQDAEISALKAQLTEMHAALIALQSKNQLVAQR